MISTRGRYALRVIIDLAQQDTADYIPLKAVAGRQEISEKYLQQIVKTLADRNGINMEEEELYLEANKWELAHGGLSGRTAQQFIDYLLGQIKE